MPRANETNLLQALRQLKAEGQRTGIYHKIQVEMTTHSFRLDGSNISHRQIRRIFETNTVSPGKSVTVDDIIEAVNHFECIDYVIDHAEEPLTREYICDLHSILKAGTSLSRKHPDDVGEYRTVPVKSKDLSACDPRDVPDEMRAIFIEYYATKNKTFDDILDFHLKFERVQPFIEGSGRIGRLILLKECLANDIVPFIFTDRLKRLYYRSMQQWEQVSLNLSQSAASAQKQMQAALDRFRIRYQNPKK